MNCAIERYLRHTPKRVDGFKKFWNSSYHSRCSLIYSARCVIRHFLTLSWHAHRLNVGHRSYISLQLAPIFVFARWHIYRILFSGVPRTYKGAYKHNLLVEIQRKNVTVKVRIWGDNMGAFLSIKAVAFQRYWWGSSTGCLGPWPQRAAPIYLPHDMCNSPVTPHPRSRAATQQQHFLFPIKFEIIFFYASNRLRVLFAVGCIVVK